MVKQRLWHTLDLEETFVALESSPGGLKVDEAERRLAEYGPNEIESAHKVSKLAILWAQVKNPLVFVLLVAAAISLLAGKTADAIVIGVVIIVNSLIGFFQEYRAEEALESLMAQAAPEAEVVRDCPDVGECVEMRIPTAKIVPGDIILLDAGAKVPADARLIEAANLEVEEAMLTGESLSSRKTLEPLSGDDLPIADRTNLIYGGTIVTNGRGRAVVYATGARTEMGKIATLIQETEKAESPLQKQTLDLGKKLGFLAVGVATLTVILGLIVHLPLQEIFLFALASAVSSIPEGLPAVMSITLAVGVNRMAKRNAIIRRLPAVDTLGAATVICSDKTGTLTTNQMTVQQVMADGKTMHVTGVGFAPEGRFLRDEQPYDPTATPDLRLALHIGALCNDARLVRHQQEEGYTWTIRGDPTEGALVVAAAKAGHYKETLDTQMPRIDELPFNSKTKFMATFHQGSEGQVWVFLKGAPETVLEHCPHIRENAKVRPLEAADRELILEENHRMASEALRVLGLAYQIIAPEEVEAFKEALEYAHPSEMVFVGLAGMMDPPRPEVPEAVERCKRAGIRVIMATGDHKVTGAAIARQVGILEEGGRVLTGPDLRKMSDDELDAVIEETSVFARVAPEHKHRIVESLQRQGHVVAMTGDGVNDAPALKRADIGVAMGITGTDVSKQTADMVLTDDNYVSIVSAIEQGRIIYSNIRKFVYFLLSCNVAEIMIIFSAILMGWDSPLTVIQLLWLNLLSDGAPALALGLEKGDPDLMERPPRPPQEPVINREMIAGVLVQTVAITVTVLLAYWRGYHHFAPEMGTDPRLTAQTMAFVTLVLSELFRAYTARSERYPLVKLGIFTNKYMQYAVGFSVALLLMVVYVPFFQPIFNTLPLELDEWLEMLPLIFIPSIAAELQKVVARWLAERH